nr:extracellular solute-binding protein [Luteimicrobium album]
MGSSSKHADAAWKFIEYMTGPEAQARMATGGEVPVRSSTYDQPYFKTDDAKLVLAIKDYVTKNSEPREYSANWLSIANGLANAAQQMYLKGGTAAQFLESAQSAANG